MLPINNLNNIIVQEDERLEDIRRENIQRRLMRDESDCFQIEDVRFKELFRLTKDMAHYVLNGIIPTLTNADNPIAISPQIKFLGVLHFYATGSYQRVIGRSFNISMAQQSMSRSIEEVTNAIIETFAATWVQFPSTEERKNEIKARFMEARNFPGVIGAVDGTHIEIIRPHEEEHAYLNRKGYHSKNVQIICDSDLKILNVNAQHAGATHDAHIWRNSIVKRELEAAYNNGDRHSWLLGDSGYAQEPWLMTPIENAVQGTPEYNYTQCHIQARNCIERCIGVFKGRFLCLSKILRYTPGKVGHIVNPCVILHNICVEGRLNYDFQIPRPVLNRRDIINIPYHGNVIREGTQARINVIQRYFM